MSENASYSASVAGVAVKDDGRVLVIQRTDNCRWEAPGGVLERDETFEQGVRREVAEETGIDVVVERLTGVYQNLMLGVVVLVFRCRPVGGRPTTSDESRDVQWLLPEEVKQRMSPAFAVRIEDVFNESPAHRSHDGTNRIDP